jgi:hypothetical protein
VQPRPAVRVTAVRPALQAPRIDRVRATRPAQVAPAAPAARPEPPPKAVPSVPPATVVHAPETVIARAPADPAPRPASTASQSLSRMPTVPSADPAGPSYDQISAQLKRDLLRQRERMGDLLGDLPWS